MHFWGPDLHLNRPVPANYSCMQRLVAVRFWEAYIVFKPPRYWSKCVVDNSKGSMANGLAKQQISLDPKDHDFFIHKERGFKPLVKTAGPTQKSEKKLKVSTHTGGCSHLRDSRARTKRHQLTVARRVDSPNLRATPLTTGLNSNPVRSFRSRMIRARAGAVRRRRSAAVEPSRERVARGEEVYSSK